MKRFALLLLLSLGAQGCLMMNQRTEVGKPFDPKASEQFELKKTTQEDVRAVLGEPFAKSTHEGKEMWSYYHAINDAQYMHVSTKGNSLALTFEGGVLIGISNTPIESK